MNDTAGFVLNRENYGSVCTRNRDGYGIHGCRYGVQIADPRYTRVKP